jgi:hypothetical protein
MVFLVEPEMNIDATTKARNAFLELIWYCFTHSCRQEM